MNHPLSSLTLSLVFIAHPFPQATPDGSQSSSAAEFSFGLVADIQFARKPDEGRRRYGSSLQRLRAAVSDWSDEELAFVVQLGDLIDGRDTQGEGLEDLALVLEELGHTEVPLWHVIGNHGLELPRRVLQERLGLTQTWYAIERGPWRFLVLDALWLGTAGRLPDDPLALDAAAYLQHFGAGNPAGRERAQARQWNGGLGPRQRAWLADELAQAADRGQRAVIFSHLPVLPASARAATVLWDQKDVLAILEHSPAFVAWIAGHDHGGGYAQIAGRHFLTLRGLVEAGEGENVYAVVHARADGLVIDGRGQAVDRVLSVPNAPLPVHAFLAPPTSEEHPSRTRFAGRPIAQTMHWSGAEWLLRATRGDEENSAALLEALGVQAGWTVADLGCGNGYFTLPLAERVGSAGRVFALDIQPEMLAMLTRRARQRQLENIITVTSSTRLTGLIPASCDLILMVDVYHELAQPELVLDQVRRALRAEGLLVIAEFRAEDPEIPILPEHKLSRATLQSELEANGFALEHSFDGLPWQHLLFFRPRW